MRLSIIALPVAALALVPAALFAETEPAPETKAEEARIPFANHGGVRDWQAEGREVIYFEDSHRNWYKAELFSPSSDLPYTLFVGIDTGATGTLDRWSVVVIDGQRYPLKSFVKIDGKPPKKSKKDDQAS